jgi:hypothetical protein
MESMVKFLQLEEIILFEDCQHRYRLSSRTHMHSD